MNPAEEFARVARDNWPSWARGLLARPRRVRGELVLPGAFLARPPSRAPPAWRIPLGVERVQGQEHVRGTFCGASVRVDGRARRTIGRRWLATQLPPHVGEL
eukprot:CAMPEP_0182886410 /NCGR_PEP_ID=MMETSP0034_2-20130328/20198_1 /TAXON_ID=156128 /ORGANISM="Nephroselmis pyriformis, Strain CCMP717" /LENGTH=101 /DNA_ID=CAMNT_0025019731 /DNA_START=18 /DNA_END=319 /DNA_ORIENTATION=+